MLKRWIFACLVFCLIFLAGCSKDMDNASVLSSAFENGSRSSESLLTASSKTGGLSQMETALNSIRSSSNGKASSNKNTSASHGSSVNYMTGVPNSLDTRPQKDTAGLINPMTSSLTDGLAEAMKRTARSGKDTLTKKGKVYYVSNRGDDSNDGTAPDRAVASLDTISSITESGSTVLFERGGIFRGQLLVRNSNLSFGAYGSGPVPCLYGSAENYVGSQWVKTSANIWTCQTSINSDVGAVILNHGEKVGVKKLTNSLTKDFNFFYNSSTGLVSLYYSQGNPAQVFKDIELSPRKNLININSGAANIIFENLCIKYTGSHGISASDCKNLTVRNCELGWIGGSILSGTERYGNAIQDWNNCDGLTVANCYIYQAYDTGVTFQGLEPSTVKNVTIKNNLIEYCEYSFEYFYDKTGSMMSNISVESNIMRFAGCGWGEAQRPDKHVASQIRSWNYYNRCDPETFIIKGNYFDYSAEVMMQINSTVGTLPTFIGNTYCFIRGQQTGWYGNTVLGSYDSGIAAKMKSGKMETGAPPPTIVFR